MISFPPSLIRPDFRVKYTQATVGITTSRILGESPDRVGIIWFPVSVGNYIVAPYPTMSGGSGIQVLSGQAGVIIKYSDWGPITGDSWYGASNGVGITFTIGELIYSPKDR